MSLKVAREMRATQVEIASIPTGDAMAARVRATRKAQRVAEAELFFLAVEAARRAPVDESCARFGCRTGEDVRVGFCDIATSWFGAVAGFSSGAAEGFLLESLEVAERLPRIYERVLDGRTRPHTARLVAEQTLMLTDEAARFVDAQVAAAGAIRGRYAIRGLVREAMIAHMPEEYEALQQVEAEPRKAEVSIGGNGWGSVEAVIDVVSAVELERSLQYGAEQLKAAGSRERLDVRRSFAFSDLVSAAHLPEGAPRQGAFDLAGAVTGVARPGSRGRDCAGAEDRARDAAGQTSQAAGASGAGPAAGAPGADPAAGAAGGAGGETVIDPYGGLERPSWSGRGVPRPRVRLYLHLNASAFWPGGDPGSGPVDPEYVAGRRGEEPVRVEGPGIPPGLVLSAAEVSAMFTRPSFLSSCGGPVPVPPGITVLPVLDLEEEHCLDGYVAGETIKEHLALRDRTCCFPFCAQAARGCDCDHMTPWRVDEDGQPVGGPTCTCNLGSLCRTHHRWKTHAHRIEDGRIGAGADGSAPGLRDAWSYEMLAPGVYYWTSPLGGRFLRTREGTIEVTDSAWHRRDLRARRDDLDQAAIERLEHEHGDDAEPTDADIEAMLADPPCWERPGRSPATAGAHRR